MKNEEARRKYDDCGFDEDNTVNSTEVDAFVDAFFGEGSRGVDGRSHDWRLGSVENYSRIDLGEVPLHMRDIVRIGLNYIVSLDHEFHDVVLLQHARVDILYLMIGVLVEGPLTQQVFDSEESYTISYYDNPLQPGITPMWGDQNVLGNQKLSAQKKAELPRKELTWEELQRRQKHALAMLENAPADPLRALEEKYQTKMLATEHERSMRAILHQDIYENDAELDCNQLSVFLSEQKNTRVGAEQTNSSIESATMSTANNPQSGDTELDNLLAVTQIEASFSGDVTHSTTPATNRQDSLARYASRGAQDVLGSSSDGVLFVAQGGKILRNEGPPMPDAPTAPQTLSRTKGLGSRSGFRELSDSMCCLPAVYSLFRAKTHGNK